MKIYMLDVGAKMYGDCVLVVAGDKSILVDGAHPGDDRAGGAASPIQEQLAQILGTQPPFHIDLLVVTHCHSDHIGCLPELYARGFLKPKAALVADERLGFGHPAGEDAAPLEDPIANQVLAALREEPQASLRTDAELAEFLSDAGFLETRYVGLLQALERDRVPMCRYGRDAHAQFVSRVGFPGLEVLGPTQEQVLVCADAIAQFNSDVAPIISDRRRQDASIDAVALYRDLAAAPALAGADPVDSPGKGAALNDQSILLVVGEGADRCLLGADMQFAAPEVSGVNPLMRSLREKVRAKAPYAFVKIPHHGSYNGLDAGVLAEWKTKALGITTGRGDPGHPSKSVLDVLNAHRADLVWARTDRNGLVEITVQGGQARMKVAKGRLSDGGINSRSDVTSGSAPATSSTALQSTPSAGGGSDDFVEVTTRIPNRATRVTVTIDIEPRGAIAQTLSGAMEPRPVVDPDPAPPPPLAGGRVLPRLLFATNWARLAANIGAAEAAQALQSIAAAGHRTVDVAGAADPARVIHQAATAAPRVAGIVILGGYDVIPSVRFDVLPPSLRAQLGQQTQDDDNFIVWSDQPYADVDGDGLADVPISRIPDGKSARLVAKALQAGSHSGADRFGLRNVARPFATPVYAGVQGSRGLLVSMPTQSGAIVSADLDSAAVYFMLHGASGDATRFWGESGGAMLEAFEIGSTPPLTGAVVFAGCCWGALVVDETANHYRNRLTPRTPDDSIALKFLESGATAFVGCTGTHYSPGGAQPSYFGGPMHVAFWAEIAKGTPPAQALFNAKVAYVAGMPHNRTKPSEQAIEYKILRQFTCLGLGW
jgi:beta-lactamase superfamily II metal-dependent hydrolase